MMHPQSKSFFLVLAAVAVALFLSSNSNAGKRNPQQIYLNTLTPIKSPKPLLADHPEFVEPIRSKHRFAALPLIADTEANLDVRAWRYSYNARGIIEVSNQLSAQHTAVIVVHPWGIDDGRGWRSPQPAGVAFFCTLEKNRIYIKHLRKVLNPFLRSVRTKVGLVAYSLPGREDAVRKKLYRSVRGRPTKEQRQQGAIELAICLKAFRYEGNAVVRDIPVTRGKKTIDYFRSFPGLDASAKYNGAGFWKLPIPVAEPIEVADEDVVIYEGEGYGVLKAFLKKQGIRHVLLTGYATDMCVCSTTAGYENLRKDFNVFLVGDATLATFPASDTPRFATTAALAKASLNLFITQASWIIHRKR